MHQSMRLVKGVRNNLSLPASTCGLHHIPAVQRPAQKSQMSQHIISLLPPNP